MQKRLASKLTPKENLSLKSLSDSNNVYNFKKVSIIIIYNINFYRTTKAVAKLTNYK